MLFDSHAHAHFNAYKDDSDEVIKRALGKGVQMVLVGTQIADFSFICYIYAIWNKKKYEKKFTNSFLCLGQNITLKR